MRHDLGSHEASSCGINWRWRGAGNGLSLPVRCLRERELDTLTELDRHSSDALLAIDSGDA
jgi:hypothetical protein